MKFCGKRAVLREVMLARECDWIGAGRLGDMII